LNPAANPLDAIREGLVVPHPMRATADEIAARLELDPTSSHLLVGGIGSGKTTQLLLAGERLRAVGDVCAEYIDVGVDHDLGHLKPGTLVVVAGLALSRGCGGSAGKTIHRARIAFLQWAHGYTRWIEAEPDWSNEDGDYDSGDFYPVHEPPLLSSPEAPLEASLAEKVEMLLTLTGEIRPPKSQLVLLFDALDRVSDLDAFAGVVEQDVRALLNAGIGVVLAGPLRSMFGSHRTIVDRFRHFYAETPVDVQRSSEARRFIRLILEKRDSEGMLTEAAREKVAAWSGGVLRDVITLAHGSVERAYLSGADEVAIAHVDAAADAFGRQLIFGLTSEEVALLQRARKTGTFVPTTEDELSLLVTRRVLEYAGVPAHFVVHPTIAPLLASIDSQGNSP
jgi:hypothetical protein